MISRKKKAIKMNPEAPEILVVEDEPAINLLFQRVLSCEGFRVITILNGSAAREALVKSDYRLIFLDIRLPGTTGKELYQWLEKTYAAKAAKVVFSTGDVMSGDTQIFLDLSNRPYLAKPFTPAELRIVVKEALQQIKN